MADRRPTCRTVDVDGTPVRVRGVGPPTEHDLAIIRDFAAVLRQRAQETTVSTSCRSCGAEIVWATTKAGTAIPVEPMPVPNGSVLLRRVGRRVLARVLGDGEHPGPGEGTFRSHFVACPDAAAHRQEKGGRCD